MSLIIKNKKAYFNYEILDKFESGIVLNGFEVKSMRDKRVNFQDSFCRFVKGELFLFNLHINYSSNINSHFIKEQNSSHKLLLHKRELKKLESKIINLTIIPLEIYFNKRNIIKVLIALAKGKTLYDKRKTLKLKTLEMEEKREHFSKNTPKIIK